MNLGVKLSATPRQLLLLGINNHIQLQAKRNRVLVWRHPQRVASLSGRMASVMGLSDTDCYKAAEGGLWHDVGKLHADSLPFLRQFHGLPVDDKLVVQDFTILHSMRGVVMLDRVNLHGSVASKEELEVICRFHHYPNQNETGLMIKQLAIIQVADIFDVITVGDEHHSYVQTVPPDEALQVLEDMATTNLLDPACVEALNQCKETILH